MDNIKARFYEVTSTLYNNRYALGLGALIVGTGVFLAAETAQAVAQPDNGLMPEGPVPNTNPVNQ